MIGIDNSYLNKNYKDTVFRMLFSDRERLLELYNALNESSYDDAGLLEITTLENAVYMGIKNDVSFIIDDRLHLYEHQSTVNPNMPYRFLLYVAESFEAYVAKNVEDIYTSQMFVLPSPKFVVLYNGVAEQPEYRQMKLSDMYIGEGERDLELIVHQYNINDGFNESIKRASTTLAEYSRFVSRVRYEMSVTQDKRQAINNAIDWCIDNNVLADFLKKNRAEVSMRSLYEFDQEAHDRCLKKEGFEEGVEQGIEQGISRGRLLTIAQLLKTMSEDEIKKAVLASDEELEQAKLIVM